MKQNMNPKSSMARRMDNMLCTAWRALKQVPFTCLVRTDSPSQKVLLTDCAGPASLWNGCQAVVGRSPEEGLC